MTTDRLTLDRPSPFRRRRFVVPHRRRSRTLLLLKPFFTALLLVGVPVTAAVWVVRSPIFLVSEVEIGALTQVTRKEIDVALQDLRGRHLLKLSLRDVEARLADNRWIGGVQIRKELPDRLVVQILERQPVALLREVDGLSYVDASGFVIGPYDPDGPVDLPLLSLQPGANLNVAGALAVAEQFDRFKGGELAGVSEIEILDLDDYRIYSAALSFPVLITGSELEVQLGKLDRLLPEIDRRFAALEAVDLRFSRQIVVQPAVEPRSEEG